MSSSVNSVTGSSSTQNNVSDAVASATKQLSQQDFLNLLVAQMTSQDPLNPTSSQDLLSQMTQFSTLSTNTALQQDISQMNNTQELSAANTLMGKQVTLQVDDSTTAQGIVSGVDSSSGTPQVVVDGKSYDLSQVISVTNATTTTTQ
jgi:flagellar basal-body rod modification protein FlgD